jgi:small basic protein
MLVEGESPLEHRANHADSIISSLDVQNIGAFRPHLRSRFNSHFFTASVQQIFHFNEIVGAVSVQYQGIRHGNHTLN